MYETEQDKMDYLFRGTTGLAQSLLVDRMSHLSPIPYTTVDEMLETLIMGIVDANEQIEQRKEYHKLYITNSESFAEFKHRFLSCANKANIPVSERQKNMFQKLEPSLQLQLAPIRRSTKLTFASFCSLAHGVYQDSATAKQRLRTRQARQSPQQFSSRQSPFQAVASTSRKSQEPSKSLSAATSFPVRQSSAFSSKERSSTPKVAAANTCYNCGEPGHYATGCPLPRKPDTALKLLELSSLGLAEDLAGPESPSSSSEDEEESGKEEL
jgi:hypothetical protein